jgi:hypothetical protein
MDPTLQAIILIWQPAAAHPLGEEDAREISTNLIGFFRTLADWAENDTVASAPGKEGPHG